MDANKLRVLREIGYEVRRTCGSCVHADIRHGGDFGHCARHTYEHGKHGETRFLSINADGWCREWERRGDHVLEGFEEFMGP